MTVQIYCLNLKNIVLLLFELDCFKIFVCMDPKLYTL